MKGLMRGVVVTGVLAGLMAVNVGRVQARAPYKKQFESKYEKVAKQNKITCNVCHEEGTDDKKTRNNHGEALAKNIGKNEKDADKIKEAMTKTEPEKSAIKDKTFGDLLKEGKLPASK